MSVDYEVFIRQNIGQLKDDIYLFRYIGDGRVEYVTKGGQEAVVVKEGEAPNEDELIFATLGRGMLKPLINGLSETGMKTESEYKLEGTLDATKKHLEDMRTIALHSFKASEV